MPGRLTGTARHLTAPADKVYFPEGKDDPNLCLAVLHPEEVEYWDMTGPKGIRYLFEAAKALLSGEARLVLAEARGTRVFYRVDLDGVAALRGYLDRLWPQALAAFQDAVEEEEEPS